MDLFTLSAKLTLDSSEFDRDIGSAEQKGSSLGEKLSGVGSVVSKGFQVAGAAASAAITAVSGLAKSAIDAYAQYDQLTGGVKTLFDTSADTVIGYAQKAYLTAGVSMNTYLEQVTSFAATLNKSTKNNYEESAEIANRAMISMSDNANKLGTDMASIQNAYQGFAKGNYTMLDNLKLGYSGTTSEMKRLVKEASKMTAEQDKLGVKIQANSLDFANVVNAIAVVQEHLGIAGTTETEALTTISGSIGLLQASWENLKTTIVDPNGDISGAIDALIFSAKTAMTNLIPAIKQALTGMGTAIAEIAPVIASELPSLISEVLPSMITAASSLIDGFLDAITSSAPTIISGAVTIITQLATALVDNIDKVVDAAGQILDAIIDVFKNSDSPLLQAVGGLLDGIKSVLSTVIDLFKDFDGTVAAMKESDSAGIRALGTALETVQSVFNWCKENQGVVIPAIAGIFAAFEAKKITDAVSGLGGFSLKLLGIVTVAAIVITHIDEIKAAVQGLKEKVEEAAKPVNDFFLGLQGGGNGTLVAGQISDLIVDYNKATILLAKGSQEAGDKFKGKLKKELEDAGFTADEVGLIIKNWDFDKPKEENIALIESLGSTEGKAETINNLLETGNESGETVGETINKDKENTEKAITKVTELAKEVDAVAGTKKITYEVSYVDGGRGSKSGEYPYMNGSGANPRTGRTEQLHAKGEWNVPYDDYPAILHRGERVLTASQARQSDDGVNGVNGTTFDGLVSAVVQAIREGMQGVQVNSYLDGRELTDAVNRYQGEDLTAGRFA